MRGDRRIEMDLVVTFVGGPGAIAGSTAVVDTLHQVKAFFDEHDRQVFLYKRDPLICELCYIYDHNLSKGMSAKYDEAKKLFNSLVPANLKLEDSKPTPPEVEIPPGTFRIGDTVQGGTGLDSDEDEPFNPDED
jgi:hypothetical protein